MNNIQQLLGNTDIYLIDQILKGRYQNNDKILDAGCGSGRNSLWFYENDFQLSACDLSQEALDTYIANYPEMKDFTSLASLDNLPYQDSSFNHIICSAVLHFAKDTATFKQYFSELSRVLAPGGSLFFRMTTDVGVEHTAQLVQDGVYYLKDDTHRFLITRSLLNEVLAENHLILEGPFKTTIVEDLRSMCTVLAIKN